MPEALAVKRKHHAEHEGKRSVLGPAENERRATMKHDAEEFRLLLRKKLALVKATISDAALLFIDAAQVSEERISESGSLVEFVVQAVLSEITGQLSSVLVGGIKVLDKILKPFLKHAVKGMVPAGGEPRSARDLVREIYIRTRDQGEAFVYAATKAVDNIHDEEAAASYRMLEALWSSAAVRDAEDDDSTTAGNIHEGVENVFFETCGAPMTGMQMSQHLAVTMMQTYNAERLSRSSSISERVLFASRTLNAASVGQIDDAIHALKGEADLAVDQTERARVGMLSNHIR